MNDILLLRHSSENYGGIEGQVFRIAKELANRKILNPILVTSNKESTFAQRFLEGGFQVYEIAIDKGSILTAASAIKSILSNHKIKIIQSHMFRESLIGRVVRAQNPSIKHIFRVHTHIDCSWIPEWRKFTYHFLDYLSSMYIDQYVCIGNYLIKELAERSKIATEKITLVSDAVEQIGQPDILNDNNLILPKNIAMVSNFTPHKGHDVLLTGLSILKERGLKIRVRLVGGEKTNDPSGRTPFTKELKERANQLGILDQLDFYGFTTNIYKAIHDIPVVVLPSDSEGIPNCLLEALSAKKLVVASNVGGIPEIITDGVNGLLHPPQNPESFANAIERVFNQPERNWNKVREAGYLTWKEKFSTDVMVRGLETVYHKLGAI